MGGGGGMESREVLLHGRQLLLDFPDRVACLVQHGHGLGPAWQQSSNSVWHISN